MTELTQARLKELLHYCPALGIFWWNERPDNTKANRVFNAMYAGKIAGYRTRDGYGKVNIDGRSQGLARLAWLYMTGDWPKADVDHANTWRLDNAWSNLREATRSQNTANRNPQGKSGVKGVRQLPSGRFEVYARKDGVRQSLTCNTLEEATAASFELATSLHGVFARISR